MSEPVAKYLGIDLETTGLAPSKDKILEVYAVALTADLTEVGNYHWITPLSEIPADIDPHVQAMHEKNGLWQDCLERGEGIDFSVAGGREAVPPYWQPFLGTLDLGLQSFIRSARFEAKKVQLLGSSVHFDDGFVRAQLPLTTKWLHYRRLNTRDVSEWKSIAQIEETEEEKGGRAAHRAKADVEYAIEKARDFATLVRIGYGMQLAVKEVLSAAVNPEQVP